MGLNVRNFLSTKKVDKKLILPFSLLITFFLCLVDQAVKILVKRTGIEFFCNRGVVFGLFPGNFWIFIIAIFIFGIAVFLRRVEILKLRLAIILIVSGGMSNLVDRVRLGCVIDFIDLKIWPVFNLADVMISLGVLSLIFLSLKQ